MDFNTAMLPLNPMLDIRKHLWACLVFSTIPLIAFALHIVTLGGMASNAALIYLPFWIGVQQSLIAMIVGLVITVAIWFFVGFLTVNIALKASPEKFRISVWVLFALIFLVAVILPWLPEYQHYRRFLGIGYTLEDCRKIDATLNGGNDRLMCIKSTSIRMVNEKDPAVNEKFCNSITEDEDSIRYCWESIAYEKGASVDFCQNASLPAARQSCIFIIATKLRDETMCQYIKDSQYRTSCISRIKEPRMP